MAKVVVVIDDKTIFLNRWRNLLEREKDGVKIHVFSHPLAFLEYCIGTPDFPETIDYLITDMKCSGFDSLKTDFMNGFKKKYGRFYGKAYLCTSLFDESFGEVKTAGYDKAIPKKPLALEELENLQA